jgi:uncharacterized protein (DUF58 family)
MGASTKPGSRRGRKGAHIRRRYEFGASALWYISVTLLIALGAFNSGNNLLFWTFGLALSLLVVSGVFSGAMLMGLRVEREWVSGASAGGVMRVRYRVRNTNRVFPAFALQIDEVGFDDGPPPRGAWLARFLGRSVPSTDIGPVACPRTFVSHVGAGEVVHPEAVSEARRRGMVGFRAVRVRSTFPFGLVGKLLLFTQPGSSVVTPEAETGHAGVLRGVTGGVHAGAPSRRPGRGEEFFALREYIHGDSPRDVAWRASARRGSLLVRQFAAPAPERVWIVLRVRTRAGSDQEDERAIRIAAGLVRDADEHGMAFGLVCPLTGLLLHPGRGAGHLARALTDLGLLELGADDGRGAKSAFPGYAGAAGSRCVVVHSGAVEARFAPAGRNIANIGTVGEAPGGATSDLLGDRARATREGAVR